MVYRVKYGVLMVYLWWRSFATITKTDDANLLMRYTVRMSFSLSVRWASSF